MLRLFRFSLASVGLMALVMAGFLTIVRHKSAVTSPYIIFQSDRSGHMEPYWMRIDGSNLRPMTAAFSERLESGLSSDGQWLLFQSHRSGNTEIYLMETKPTASAEWLNLTQNPAGDYTPRWSPPIDLNWRPITAMSLAGILLLFSLRQMPSR